MLILLGQWLASKRQGYACLSLPRLSTFSAEPSLLPAFILFKVLGIAMQFSLASNLALPPPTFPVLRSQECTVMPRNSFLFFSGAGEGTRGLTNGRQSPSTRVAPQLFFFPIPEVTNHLLTQKNVPPSANQRCPRQKTTVLTVATPLPIQRALSTARLN